MPQTQLNEKEGGRLFVVCFNIHGAQNSDWIPAGYDEAGQNKQTNKSVPSLVGF